MRNLRILLLLLTLIGLTLSPLLASGGGSSTPSTPALSFDSTPTQTPQQMAASEYDAGLRLRDKAWKLEEKADATANEAQRAKLTAKMEKQFEKAIERFTKATKLNPQIHQAWSSLGYALRRTGKYDSALRAYDQALELAPNYSEAIEYRAEAYLGLGRLDDVKKSYMLLFVHDRPRADELLTAMQEWIEARQKEPGNVETAALESFAGWVSERSEVAGQVAAASGSADASW